MRRRVGPETITQSVCRSFLRRARAGEFQLADSEGLWRLLCAITLTKVNEHVRFHRRQKRAIDRERQLDSPASSEGERNAFDPADTRVTPAEALEFQEQFEQLLALFDDEERQLVELKLQQFTNDETATRMSCSERTVRRLLQRVKARLQDHLTGA
jgi:RNA polymerase sigma-70 factor, ECF subfamily